MNFMYLSWFTSDATFAFRRFCHFVLYLRQEEWDLNNVENNSSISRVCVYEACVFKELIKSLLCFHSCVVIGLSWHSRHKG